VPVQGSSDADHANALTIDPNDGNYLVSFRNLDAVIKLDARTGAVLWQLGGVQNQFTIIGDPLGGFQGQHFVRVLDDGNLLFFDNGLHHAPAESRAVEYRLDTQAMTATLVWQFRHTPAIFTPVVGSVERLASGNTLVAFANAGVVDEVTPDGSVVWEGRLLLNGATLGAYRILRLPSLYEYEKP
jgi:outer membrane protein assembly factor BamB